MCIQFISLGRWSSPYPIWPREEKTISVVPPGSCLLHAGYSIFDLSSYFWSQVVLHLCVSTSEGLFSTAALSPQTELCSSVAWGLFPGRDLSTDLISTVFVARKIWEFLKLWWSKMISSCLKFHGGTCHAHGTSHPSQSFKCPSCV